MAEGRWKAIAVRGPVRALAFAGTHLVTGGEDAKVRVWEPLTGSLVQQFDGHTRAVQSVCVVGDLVVSCSEDRTARVWDPRSGRQVRQLDGHSGRVASVVPTSSGIVSASADGTIRLWNVDTGDDIRRYSGPTKEVVALAVVPPGDRFLSGGYDGVVRLHEVETASVVREFVGHAGPVWAVGWLPGLVVSAGYDGTCWVWDADTGNEVRRLSGPARSLAVVAHSYVTHRANDPRVTRDATAHRVALGLEDGTVVVVDPTTGDELATLMHGGTVRASTFGDVGDRLVLATGSSDGTVALWHPFTGESLHRFPAHTARGVAVSAATAGGEDVFITGGFDKTVRAWAAGTGAEVEIGSLDTPLPSLVLAHRFGPSLTHPTTGTPVGTPLDPRTPYAHATPDGVELLAGGDFGAMQWDTTSGRSTWDHTVDGPVGAVAGDEHVRVVGRNDGVVDLIAAGRVLHSSVPGHEGAVESAVILDATGLRFATGGADGDVRLWDRTGDSRVLPGHAGPVLALTAAPGGRVVSAGADGTVRVWDPASGLEMQSPLLPHDGAVRGVAVAGHLVASIGDDGMVAVQPLVALSPTRPHTALLSDEASPLDRIGSSGLVARALADFLLDPETRPPVTIGLKGAWGGGKTSTMLMIRDLVDPRETSGRRRRLALVPGRGSASLGARLVARFSRRGDELTTGEAFEQAAYREDERAQPEGLAPDPQRVWRPSAWFNPWHHQTGEQVWAGLATTIIDEVTGRMGALDRERFFLRLNLARFDPSALRRCVHRALWRRVAVPLAVVAASALLVASVGGARVAAGAFSVATLATLAVSAVTLARSPLRHLHPALVRRPGEDIGDLASVVTDPDHAVRLGYSYLAYVDLKRVIDLVATPQRPLVVFIDDLDRCSSAVVTQTLEALNLFLAGPFANCTFVMAVEPKVLAAHVASAYRELADGDEQLGWRFLEKMVQVPVSVPRPTRKQASAFITDLLPPVDEHPHPLSATDAPRPPTTIAPKSPSRAAEPPSDRPPAISIPDDPAEPRPQPAAPSASQERFARTLASDPAFHEACVWAAENLVPSRNPRQLKRLLVMTEVYALVANRLGYLDLYEPAELTRQLREIGVLAALNVRWPHVIDRLLAPAGNEAHDTLVLDDLPLDGSRPDWLPTDLQQFIEHHRDALGMASRLTTLQPADQRQS